MNTNERFSGKWSDKSLSDLAVVTMGQSPSSVFYNSRGEGSPLIQGNADIKDRKTIERVWTTQGNKRCNLGDLILTVRAPVGSVAVASKNACIGRGVCGLKPIGDSSFLFHALVHAEDRWQALEQGSTFTAANSDQVGKFPLRVPDNENEQRAIAKVLSDVDGLINALDALIAKKRAIKQATMQQLLTGKTRLPGFTTPWQTKRIDDLFDAKAGGDLVQSMFSDIKDNRYPFPIYANSLTYQGLYGFSTYSEEQAGSITVTARGTLGQAFYRDEPFVAIGRLIVLIPKVPLDGRFFCEFINYGIHFAIERYWSSSINGTSNF